MAWTVTRNKTIMGDKAVVGMKIVTDAATQAVETGLSNILFYSLGISSMTTVAGLNVAANSNASGVQSFGVLGCSGFTTGDVFYVTVYGTR